MARKLKNPPPPPESQTSVVEKDPYLEGIDAKGDLDETSAKLLNAMEHAAKEATVESARDGVFKVLNSGPKNPKMPSPMERFIETVFLTDDLFEEAVQRLAEAEADYKQHAKTGSYAQALMVSEESFRDAHQLLVAFQRAVSRFENEMVHAWGHVRDEATKSLQREKDAKTRTKQITNEDVESRAALIFPEEWRLSCERRRDNELAESRLKQQIDEWASRCRTFQVLVNKR